MSQGFGGWEWGGTGVWTREAGKAYLSAKWRC